MIRSKNILRLATRVSLAGGTGHRAIGAQRYFFDKLKKFIPSALTQSPQEKAASDALNQHIDKSVDQMFGNKPGIGGFLLKTFVKKVGNKMLKKAEATSHTIHELIEDAEDKLLENTKSRRMFGDDVQILGMTGFQEHSAGGVQHYTVVCQAAGRHGQGNVTITATKSGKSGKMDIQDIKFASAANPFEEHSLPLKASVSVDEDYGSSTGSFTSSESIGGSSKQKRTVIDVNARDSK